MVKIMETRNNEHIVVKTYSEQLREIIRIKNIPRKTVEVNAKGQIVIDKEKDPELYDWAANG